MIFLRLKIFILLALISLVGCSREEEASELQSSSSPNPQSLILSTNIHDTDTDGDGFVDQRIKTVSRGERQNRILVEIYQSRTDNELELRSRTFRVGDESPVTESDDDKDGFLETVIIYSSNRENFEVFRRHPDGSISTVSGEELVGYKQMHAAFSTFFDQAFEGQLDGDEVTYLFEETRQELEDAEAKINASRSNRLADQTNSISDYK